MNRDFQVRVIRCSHGFSLVELLVVLLIIGLGFSFFSFSVGGNNDHKLSIEAKQFANRTALIAEEAVLSNQQWGVDVYRQLGDDGDQYGYRWLTRNDEGVWQLANADREVIDFLFSPGIGLRLALEGGEEELEIFSKREIVEQKAVIEQKQSVVDQLTEDDVDESKRIQPALWLLSSGEMSAFQLTLFDSDSSDNQVTIKGDELGRIVVETNGANDE